MVARTLWLWLSIGWLTEAVLTPSSTSICDLGPCRCIRGMLLCDCSTSFLKEVVLRESLLSKFFSSIKVTNCFHLHVASNAVLGLTGLQQISIANVKQITLEEKAFNWRANKTDQNHNGLFINISNCNLQQIPSYTFIGSIKNIFLFSVNISRIGSYAFSSIDYAEKIEFSRVRTVEVETQSFKSVSVEFLSILESNFSALPERTMTDVTVYQEVRFDQAKINRMEMSALRINSPRNFRLIKSTVEFIESNAFEIHTKGDVSIHDNVFSHLERHAFTGISVEEKYLKEAGKQDFVFENNTLIEFENEALKLNISGFDPRLDWIMLKQKCSCDSATSWMDNLVLFSSNTYPKGKHPPLDKLIYCLNPKPTSVADFKRLYCSVSRFSVIAIVVGAIVVVIALSVIVLVVYCGIKKRGKKYINVPTAASNLRPPEDNKAHMLVVPDGKTYRETELHVIFEHADAIKATNFVKGRPDNDTHD